MWVRILARVNIILMFYYFAKWLNDLKTVEIFWKSERWLMLWETRKNSFGIV